ncbi:trypsin-like peptidase domain-containing protein [Desulfoluna sp.]|uniref:S1C family serine protease n=1 Tax=Desulfoluna sp. TaxID=2045199 RepID=UPI0026362E3E|nr:trypsin-like peptidase domain-containing protein [Desulfoluna sp.]
MKCPKCDHEQSPGLECEACGIVFEKYLEMQERLAQPLLTLSDRTPSRASGLHLSRWIRIAVSIVILGAIFAFAMRLTQKAPSGESPTQPATKKLEISGITQQLYQFKQPGNAIETSQLATVFIETPWGSGSGFFIDSTCRILTNKHVLTIDEEEIKGLRRDIQVLEYVIANKNQSITDAEGTAPFVVDPTQSVEINDYIQEQQKNSDALTERYIDLKSRLMAIEENRDNPTYTVVLFDDSSFSVTGATFSENHDLAMLELDQEACPCLKAGKSKALKVGQPVFTIGNPMGLSHTVTSGIVSGRRTHEERTYIQTDAPINPGNSGGPLIDEKGRVVGINTMILANTEGIGFAIPIETALDEFEELKR